VLAASGLRGASSSWWAEEDSWDIFPSENCIRDNSCFLDWAFEQDPDGPFFSTMEGGSNITTRCDVKVSGWKFIGRCIPRGNWCVPDPGFDGLCDECGTTKESPECSAHSVCCIRAPAPSQ
jgi:hypothetical protein